MFGTSPPAGGWARKVIKADPFNACSKLRNNCAELEGNFLLVERGHCHFLHKAFIARLSCPPTSSGEYQLLCSQLASDCRKPGAVGDLIRERCPKTCGKCSTSHSRRRGAPARARPPVSADLVAGRAACEDDDAGAKVASRGWVKNCEAARSQCSDPTMGREVRRLCPKSCHVCSSSRRRSRTRRRATSVKMPQCQYRNPAKPTTAPTTAAEPAACADDDAGAKAASGGKVENCAAAKDLCQHGTMGSVVQQHCPKICGMCARVPNAPAPTEASCHDADSGSTPVYYGGPVAVLIGNTNGYDIPARMFAPAFYPGGPLFSANPRVVVAGLGQLTFRSMERLIDCKDTNADHVTAGNRLTDCAVAGGMCNDATVRRNCPHTCKLCSDKGQVSLELRVAAIRPDDRKVRGFLNS